jgi:hypothetical protein
MADTRGLGSRRTRKNLTSTNGIACGLLLLVGGAMVAHGYFLDRPAPVGERGDRIDFSSLATVVSVDEYVASEVQGLRSEYKDDKLGRANVSLALAAANVVKVNFGTSLDDTDRTVSTFVAQHTAKLQQHLERGWSPEAAARGDLASAANLKPRIRGPNSPALVPASLAGRAGLGSRTGTSGLAP